MKVTEIRSYTFKSESCFSMFVENNGTVAEVFINAQSYISIQSMLSLEQKAGNTLYGTELVSTKIK